MKTHHQVTFHSPVASGLDLRWSACAVLLTLCGLLSSGCSRSDELSEQAAPATQIAHRAEQGEVELTSGVDHRVVQVAQPIHLELTATAPAGVSVQFPETPDRLGSFQIVDTEEQLDVPQGENRQWQRVYTLESLNSGKKAIPPIQVSFVDRRLAKSTTGVVVSAPIELEVTSLLEGQVDPTKFRDIKDVVDLRQVDTASSWAIYGWLAGGITCLAGAALFLWFRHRRKYTPAEWALIQLAQLEQSDLLKAGETHIFYCGLTDIVRHYIEDRYGYRAPRQTTSEFLSAVQREDLLCDEHQAPLQEFLQVADMVKFARHSPSRDEAAAAIDKARQFVHDTARDDTAKKKEQLAA